MNKIYLLPLLLTGCVLHDSQISKPLTDMQSIALCQNTAQAVDQEKKVTAEHGYKRFAHHTYRPLLKQKLFGHRVRAITLGPSKNMLYVAGTPVEYKKHFSNVLENIVCSKGACQAVINEKQTLYISKAKRKKSKNTTVIKCTKAEEKIH